MTAPLDLAAIRERHYLCEVETHHHGGVDAGAHCIACGKSWPCDAAQLVAALADARARVEALPLMIDGRITTLRGTERDARTPADYVELYRAAVLEALTSPAPLIDRERLARAVRSVTAAKRLDIIENDDDDMAGVVFPAEFAALVADAYERVKP